MKRINVSMQSGVAVLSIAGYFSLGSTAELDTGESVPAPQALRDIVSKQLERGTKKLVVDLSECSGLDSSAIGSLVIVATKTANSGGQLALVVVPKTKVMDVLKMTKIFSVFKVFDSVDGAIQDLTQSKTA